MCVLATSSRLHNTIISTQYRLVVRTESTIIIESTERETHKSGTEQMSPRGAGAGDCACVRPVTGSTTISREQQVQDCGCTDTARSSASTSTQHPDALYYSPRHRNPCGLPTVSLRRCPGLAADELIQGIHEEIMTLLTLYFHFSLLISPSINRKLYRPLRMVLKFLLC